MIAVRILLTLLIVMLAPLANAHEIRPSVADINLVEDGFEVEMTVTLEALIAEIDTELEDTSESENAGRYDVLRAMTSAELQAEFENFKNGFLENLHVVTDGAAQEIKLLSVDIPEVGDAELSRDTVLTVTGTLPAGAKEMVFGWASEYGALIVRVTTIDGVDAYSSYLQPGQNSDPFSLAGVTSQPAWSVFKDFIPIGFTHIVPKGLDHILFVVGLFLLSIQMRPLLWQISTFTVAHTISLALGILGIVTVPPSIVEPLIALSILYVCVENILLSKLSPWRPVVVFLFGLLHGLGFAGVLQEVGIVEGQFVAGLIGFNVGVELGQLLVIAICFVSFGYWFGKKEWYRRFITTPMSIVIACIAAFWFVQRIAF